MHGFDLSPHFGTKLKIIIFSITGSMSFIAFIANVILAKMLPIKVFGKLGFIIMIAPLLSVVSLRGQNIWLLRLIAKNKNEIKWKHLATNIIYKSLGVGVIIFSIVFLISGYSFKELSIIMVIGITQIVVFLVSSCLRAINRDIEGLLLLRIIPLFLLAIAGVVYLSGRTSSIFVIGLLAVGYCMQCFFALNIFINAKEGEFLPRLEDQPTRSSIFPYNLSTLLLLQSDRFICNIGYGFDQYAIYHASKLIMRPIQLITETMDYYTLPRLATSIFKEKLKKYLYETLIIALILGVVYFLWGNSIFKYLFSGKFGNQKLLILSLTVLELIILIQIPLSNYLQANGKKKQLWKLGIFGIGSIIFVWIVFLVINKFVGLPLAFVPIGFGCVFAARAILINIESKES
ncbi:MAG: lipopolysaccharide biosynthesis protein [Candidatus Helarchaeota archaeon]